MADITPTGIASTSEILYVHALRSSVDTVTVVQLDPSAISRDVIAMDLLPSNMARRVDTILTWDDLVGGATILDGGTPDMGATNYADGGGAGTASELYEVTYEGNWTGV